MSSALTRPERIPPLFCDTKGHFTIDCSPPEEAKYKLYKERKTLVDTKGIPHLVTHDAHTTYLPDALIKMNDTVQIDLETNKIYPFHQDEDR